jgi:hypothetical protein
MMVIHLQSRSQRSILKESRELILQKHCRGIAMASMCMCYTSDTHNSKSVANSTNIDINKVAITNRVQV